MNITTEKSLRLALFLVVGAYCLHFLILGFLVSPWDYDHLAGYYETAWRFWKTGGGLPHYNPYQCGGRSLGGDPQNFIFSPWTAFVPILGAMWVIKIQMLFELALGLWGLQRLFHRFQFATTEQIAGYFFFLSGGAVVSRFVAGHVTLGFYFLYPLLLALSFQIKKSGDLKSLSFLGYLFLFVYAGNYKPNFYIYGLLPLALEVFFRCVLTRSFFPLLPFTLATLASVGVNAIYLLPSQRYFADFPRHDFDEWLPIPLSTYFFNLLMPLRTLPNHWYGPRFLQRHEYNLFLGPILLWLAYRGAGVFRRTERNLFFSLLFASLLCLLIGLGGESPSFSLAYPYTWFWSWWPGFQSIRVPTRFWILSAFFLTLLAAKGAGTLHSQNSRRLFFWFGVIPLLLSALVNLSKTVYLANGTQWNPPRKNPEERAWVANDADTTYRHLREGKGVLACVKNMQLETNPVLRPGDSLSFQTSAPAAVSSYWKGWNQIEISIQSQFPVSVGFNLNAHPYWAFEGSEGTLLKTISGPLTLFAKDGHTSGTLVFNQPMSMEGLVTTLASLVVLLLYAAWIFRNNQRIRIVGLTGGVASGKSIVAEAFQREGIPVFNMDTLGREILERDPHVREALKAICGPGILKADGSVDRMQVRVILFSDPQKKKRIESVLHPAIWKEFYRRAKLEKRQGKKTVICEAALLIESKRMDRLDGLVAVLADKNTRLERLMERDQITREFAEEMLRNQTSDEERKRHAQVLIENHGSREEFLRQSIELVRQLKKDGFV